MASRKSGIPMATPQPEAEPSAAPEAAPKEDERLTKLISDLEQYSQSLVKNFEGTTKAIHERLAASGGVVIQALRMLASTQGEIDTILNTSFGDLEAIIQTIESLLPDFEGLETVQTELLLLSDMLTTVEEAVQRRQ
jgi:hypothetical protein